MSSVSVTATSASISAGQTVQLIATATFSDGTTQAVTALATWQSSNPSIVAVSASGVLTAIATGEADISATYRSVVGTFRVRVTSPIPQATLQLHFLNVDQGDAAVLVSDRGETILFDDGVSGSCTAVVNYLRQLGLARIDYHIASHYHADHIGCASAVFSAFPLSIAGLDRGGSYTSQTFSTYVATIGGRRQTVAPGMTVTLDGGTAAPVSINVIASNADGLNTDDENALSVVAVVRFGNFHAVLGGDLTGSSSGGGIDVESRVAGRVGAVEVYKVHHHGSRYSSNASWLAATTPLVGIVSVGAGNSYGHPHQESMDRLHAAGVHTYWTTTGRGVLPMGGLDTVAGTVVVEAQAGSSSFAVRYGSATDTYQTWEHWSGLPNWGVASGDTQASGNDESTSAHSAVGFRRSPRSLRSLSPGQDATTIRRR
ncbi:MAG: Ig-like domain-containing protein [Planctomycetes bacterium]|nr:Ig-like domain-containing protein [Planctomycetota bacterium]